MRIVVVAMLVSALAQQPFTPAKLLQAAPPAPPGPQVVGWGETTVEAAVTVEGSVASVIPIRVSEPFTKLLRDAVSSWRFEPARAAGKPTPARVLVAAVFRPPALNDAPAAPAPPANVPRPSPESPAPIETPSPPYPPKALGDAVVIVEALVGPDGAVQSATAVRQAAGFTEAALETARRWKFRPAHRDGGPVSVSVYLVFGFRPPLTSEP